ncbi:phospholipase [Micromonospora sp. AMSO31t]|uniref:phospholipase n=1 Tax=Micromonospora sp. AMSO31t TaxID=2650566 RepID=UPI00124B0B70|nr:phospholipase [Micromonospora sp. AMSO31t]KAB1914150.1 phospholipase [Micromonospora sp. AMSO31t]
MVGRRERGVVLVVVAGLIATGAPARADDAAAPDGTYYLQSVRTGLNAAERDGVILQRSPRGDEDRQQWRLRTGGDGHLLENTVTPGWCLGRRDGAVVAVGCADPAARWVVTAAGPERFTLAEPGAGRVLTAVPGRAELSLEPAGATWYLTPVEPVTRPLPAEDERRLDQVTFLTAHNAYANGVDGGFAPPVLDLLPNQVRGVERQLAGGVRGFQLDIHQTRDGAILCHNSCFLVFRPVALWVDLQRIVDFLRGNPREFVTVFLEDYVSAPVLRAELARVQGLTDLLYRPDLDGVPATGWPRLRELRERDRRLLIFTDRRREDDQAGGLTRDTFGVLYQREWTVENYWSMGRGVGASDWTCVSRWPDRPLTDGGESAFRPLFVMNHFRDAPVPVTAAADNAGVLNRAGRFCQPAARKKPNYVAVDRYDLGGPAAAVTALNTYWY